MTFFSHSQNKSQQALSLVILVSFLLTFTSQVFATSVICLMDQPSIAISQDDRGPCDSMSAKTEGSISNLDDFTANDLLITNLMDCCDQYSLSSTTSSPMSSGCSCPDSGCAASISFMTGLPSSSLFISEQANSYSTAYATSQIDSALFRPPIA